MIWRSLSHDVSWVVLDQNDGFQHLLGHNTCPMYSTMLESYALSPPMCFPKAVLYRQQIFDTSKACSLQWNGQRICFGQIHFEQAHICCHTMSNPIIFSPLTLLHYLTRIEMLVLCWTWMASDFLVRMAMYWRSCLKVLDRRLKKGGQCISTYDYYPAVW